MAVSDRNQYPLDELEKRKKILPLYSENEDSKEDRYCDFDTINSSGTAGANGKDDYSAPIL